jgi:hypothetical protein
MFVRDSAYSNESTENAIEKGKKKPEISLLQNASCFAAEFGYVVRLSVGEVVYDFYIEGLFPERPPRIFQVSPKSEHSGSDILPAVLECKWDAHMHLSDVALKLKPGLQGKFHIGHTFPLYLFETTQIFQCTALNPINFKPVVSQNYLFQVEEHTSKNGHLVAFGKLLGIKCIKKGKDPKRFAIVWRGPIEYYQVFRAGEAENIIEAILANLRGLGGRITKETVTKKLIKEEEVTPQFILKIKIQEIESEIIETELDLEGGLVKERINHLIQLYQKAIEYYSALGDQKFDAYLNKMRNLMSNAEVMRVLTEENTVVVASEPMIVKEIEEQEIWPENISSSDIQ